MQLHLITFGQVHKHAINGKTFDRDTIAVFVTQPDEDTHKRVVDYFGLKFAFDYPEEHWNSTHIDFFPKGYVDVDGKLTHEQIHNHLVSTERLQSMNDTLQ